MTHIILTKEEADKVRGVTTPGHALDPVPLADGVSFILPLEVLSDPARTIRAAHIGQGYNIGSVLVNATYDALDTYLSAL